jgi:hypothetical protein
MGAVEDDGSVRTDLCVFFATNATRPVENVIRSSLDVHAVGNWSELFSLGAVVHHLVLLVE